jgi:uncharacterized GH25 family protein
MSRQLLLSIGTALLALAPARAHDYWLEPETFFPKAGESVTVRLHVGDHFVSEAERPFQKKPTLRFDLVAAGKKFDLAAAGRDGQAPVAKVDVAAPGAYLLAMERAPQLIRLEAAKFNRYLKEEGLEAILARRKQDGEEHKEGRERYSRCLKCLLQCGDANDDTFGQRLGQQLEIVPSSNPSRLKAGDSLTVQVLFEGKPLPGTRLFAYHRVEGKGQGQALTTAKDGRATFQLERAGPWLVRLVHMRRCADAGEADWESYWAALTFGIPGAGR